MSCQCQTTVAELYRKKTACSLSNVMLGGPKISTFLYASELRQILTNYQTFFTVRIRRKFVIVLSLKIPLHVKCFATLLCEMSVSYNSVSQPFFDLLDKIESRRWVSNHTRTTIFFTEMHIYVGCSPN